MQELDKIQIAIIKANDEWENSYHSKEAQDEYVEGYCQEAYLTMLAFIDKHNLTGLRDYAIKEWENHKGNLLNSFYSEAAETPFLAVTGNFLYPMLVALSNVYGTSESIEITANNPFKLKQAIELLPHTALKLNYNIKDEDSIDKLIEAFLTPIYPDLNSNPSLTLPEGYRQPDSSIPSLTLLLEYKYIKNKTEIRKVIDEAQADIRNYAQSPWQYLYFVIGMNEAYTTKEKIEMTLLKEPSSFKKIIVSLVKL